MSEISIKSEPEHYLDALGLRVEPFASQTSSLPMFRTPAIQKTIDAALYIARYSDLVALIHGPSGSGKSTLFRALATHAGANVHVISIAGTAKTSADVLRASILESFKLVEPLLNADEQVRQIREQIDLLQRKGYQCLMLVDDADALPRDSFILLEALMNIRNSQGKSLVNLILFAPRADSVQFDGPTLRHRVKPVALTPLTDQECYEYILDRLTLAGNAAAMHDIFSERGLARIARESKGWPGAVGALAQQRLLRHVGRKAPAVSPPDAPAFAKAQIALASAFGIALVASFVFQQEINTWFGVQPAPDTETISESTTPAADPLLASTMTTTVATLAADLPALPEIASTPSPGPESLIEPEVATTLPVAAVTPPPAPEPVVAPVAAADVPPHPQEWLLNQNPAAYTIQLVGSTDPGDVRRALKRLPPTENGATFTTTRNSKTTFGLVQGVFPDMASAQRAREQLPEAYAKNAWVRRISTLQQEIALKSEQPTTETASTPLP